MSRKVIYVSSSRLTDKTARDWYISYLIENGTEVEYWDVVSLVREPHNEEGELDVTYVHVLQSYSEFEILVGLKSNTDAIYVMLLTPEWRTRLPFTLLSKYNCKMVFINWGAMPTIATPKLQRALHKLIKNPFVFFGLLVNSVLWMAYKKLNFIKPFDVVFAAGSIITKRDHFAKKIVPINLCDYDNYLNLKEVNDRAVDGKYAVFLDINLPYHSDLKLTGWPTVDPSEYYQSLNSYFLLLEQKYDLKIVIAMHPRTSTLLDVFDGRKTFRMCTAELVKDADFVISHTSTALSYAVLNLKPLIFIYTREMEVLNTPTIFSEIFIHADYFNLAPHNISEFDDVSQVSVKEVNETCYDNYKYRYLTSKESEGHLSQEVFFREINSIK